VPQPTSETAELPAQPSYPLASGRPGVAQLAEQLSLLGDQMRGTQQMIARMAEQQAQLTPVLTQLAAYQGQSAIDDAARGHLRNTELLLARLLDEVASGRAQSTQELRSEIRVLTRTIMAISGGTQQVPGTTQGG